MLTDIRLIVLSPSSRYYETEHGKRPQPPIVRNGPLNDTSRRGREIPARDSKSATQAGVDLRGQPAGDRSQFVSQLRQARRIEAAARSADAEGSDDLPDRIV